MKVKTTHLFILNILLIILANIVTTTTLMAFGSRNFSIHFEYIVVVYWGLKIKSPFISVFILLLMIVNEAFTIEGWAIGTFTGIFVNYLLRYIQALISISDKLSTFITVLITQLFYFIIVTSIICLKTEDFSPFFPSLWAFIPQSIVTSIIALYVFHLFDKIWKYDNNGVFRPC